MISGVLGGGLIHQVLLNLYNLKSLLKCTSVTTISKKNVNRQIHKVHQNVLALVSKAQAVKEINWISSKL